MVGSKTKKVWYKRWWAITLFIFVGIIILGGLFGDDSPTLHDTTPQQDTQNNVVQSEQTISEGMGISRSYIIEIFENPDLGYSFEKGVDINGQDNYVGSNDVGTIQLIGPPNDLTEVSILIALGSDVESNILAGVNLWGFANVIDSNSKDWVLRQFEIIGNDPTKEYQNSKIFNNKLYKISFTPIEGVGNLMSLTVEPA